MKIAFLGCGYVANMYRLTLPMHPELELVAVMDIELARAENMAALTGAKIYTRLNELLSDASIELVVNLTIPQAHYQTTLACLQAGKHVYSEKPLAMSVDEARHLVEVANANQLILASAPCTLMSPTAQTLWHAINQQLIGPIRLIYAEMEDGMVAKAPVKTWVNEAGVAWPFVNEFETGCTVEHAGYVLSWLAAMFGPIASVTAFADTLLPEKIPEQRIAPADDFTVACLKFNSGVVARMTNGIYAEHNHKLQLFGDDGVLSVADPRSDISPVMLRRYHTLRRKRFLSPWHKKLPFVESSKQARITKYRGSQVRDFCRVIADIGQALQDKRKPYFSAEFALHITEVTLACQYAKTLAQQGNMPYQVASTFSEIKPL